MVLQPLPLMASQCSNQDALWSSSELAGWASKRSHGVKTWNHRYCVIKDSYMFYFRDELLHVLRGVIPLEGALLRKPKPIQRSAGSAELRYCLVLYVAAKASESCRHKQYEFCWNSAEEQSKWARALMLACIPRKALLKEAAHSGRLVDLLLPVRTRASEKGAASLRSEPSGAFLPDIDTNWLASPVSATTPRACSITSTSSQGPSEAVAKKRASLLATAVRSSKFGAALQPVQSSAAEAPQADRLQPPTPAQAAPQQPPDSGERDAAPVQRQPSTLWELAQAGAFNTPSEDQLIGAYLQQPAQSGSGTVHKTPPKSGSVIIHGTPPHSGSSIIHDLPPSSGSIIIHDPPPSSSKAAAPSPSGSSAADSPAGVASSTADPPQKAPRTLKSLLPFRSPSKAAPTADPAPPHAAAKSTSTTASAPSHGAAAASPSSKAQPAAQRPSSGHRQSPSVQGCDDALVDLLTSFLAMAVQQEKQAVSSGTTESPFDAELAMLLEATALPSKPRRLPAQAAQGSSADTAGGHVAPAPMHRRAASQQIASVRSTAPPIRDESNLLTSLQAELARRHTPVPS